MSKHTARQYDDSSGNDYNTLEKDKRLTKHSFTRIIVTIECKQEK